MIVKNEEKNIEKALKSFIPVADEIIIVDTGSTDDTKYWISQFERQYLWVDGFHKKEFVKGECNDIVLIEEDWKNDFSNARNISINRATCDWILWLDADDRISESEYNKINKLKQAPLDRFFKFQIKDFIGGLPLGKQWAQTRMFPRRDDIRFQKPIHEQVVYDCRKAGLNEINVDCTIWHIGYDEPGSKAKKAERNLSIMYANNYGHDNGHETMLLGNALSMQDKWQEAISMYEKVYKHNEILRPVAAGKIGMGYVNLKEYKKALPWLEQSGFIDATYQAGICYEKLKDFKTALKYYRKAIDTPNKTYIIATDFDFCRMHSYHRAFLLMNSLDMRKEALIVLQNLHRDYPDFKMEI
jgi:glycosyltransferase involved in cell wall biosynthesis